jgi:hypothetical protein
MNNILYAYHSFCEERFPVPTADDVSALENRLGISLPLDYREYLLEYNGGIFTEPRIVPPSEDCPLDRLTVMAGVCTPHEFAELCSPGGFTPAIFDDNDPPQILPIGGTMMGNLLYMNVYSEDEERGWIGIKLAFSDRCYYLASGIEGFFGLLSESPED